MSESTGYTLNVNGDTNSLELSNRSRDTWTKYNWLIEKIIPGESNYDEEFIDGTKRESGQLRQASEPGRILLSNKCLFCLENRLLG